MRLFPLLFLLGFHNLSAQKIQLELKSDNASFTPKYKKELANPREAEKEISKIMQQYHGAGYLAAYIDERISGNGKDSLTNHMKVIIKTGQIYETGKIRKGNAEEKMLSAIGYREKIYRHKILSQKLIVDLADKIIGYYENNGYPFAEFRLDSVVLHKNILNASLSVSKNKLYRIDSIFIKGGAKINKNYIENYISIKEGDLYNEKLIRAIDSRLKELPFAEIIKGTEIVFTENQCLVYVYIKEKKASQFNGIIGILPNNQTGKITVTGDARIRLKNTLHSGELFDLNWRKLNTDIQDMRINLNYPFLFKSSFGVDAIFKLYKKDTTFLELNEVVALQYLLKSGNFFKISLNHQNSNLITPSMFSTVTSLPGFADVSSTLYGIGTKMERLDYRLNPRKGFSIGADLQAGRKTIRKNPVLNEMIYDGINLKTVKYAVTLQADLFVPVLKRATIKAAINSGWIENENLFVNELYRLGGIRTLRGFNEESIFASFFSVNTLEFRYLLEQNSNIYVFVDHCYYERKTATEFVHDTPLSFGAGISFQTKAGIFSMNYALGKEQQNPFIVKGAKVHFGFVNYF